MDRKRQFSNLIDRCIRGIWLECRCDNLGEARVILYRCLSDRGEFYSEETIRSWHLKRRNPDAQSLDRVVEGIVCCGGRKGDFKYRREDIKKLVRSLSTTDVDKLMERCLPSLMHSRDQNRISITFELDPIPLDKENIINKLLEYVNDRYPEIISGTS